MNKMDFSLCMYKDICKALQSHKTFTVLSFLTENPKPPYIVLRHDVDRNINNALKMAELEHEFEIRSTYYFRYPKTFDVTVMKKISCLGHEIGYHYEVLDKAKGDIKKAIELFQKELKIFREFFLVDTVCMHGNPLTVWDGKDIWKAVDFKDYGLCGEAFLSVKGITYLTDTGRNWNGANNLKDRVSQANNNNSFKSTVDVIKFLQDTKENIYFNVHPERWGADFAGWLLSFLRDKFFNLCKRAIKRLRPNGIK